MRRMIVPAMAVLLLAGCSKGEEAESADEFAKRIGYEEGATEAGQEPVTNTAVDAPPPPSASPLNLEKLGDIANADLGPRDGGCTFSQAGTELLLAGAPNDPASGGKAVVRIGGALLMLDSSGGLPAIKAGTSFSGQGFKVQVAPVKGTGAQRRARLVVTDAKGKQKAFDMGDWVCSG